MQNGKTKNIAFAGEEAQVVYTRLMALFRVIKERREAANPKKKYFLWMLIGDMLKEWEKDFQMVAPYAEPVILKSSDGSQYIQRATAHGYNFGMTNEREEAMTFANPEQARAFLRQAGRDVSEWIIEPVNQ